MSDYTPVNDFSAKDSLTSGDPEKVILGSDMDAETAAIQTAVNTKYDSDDLASQAQAEAESSNVVLMTPLRVSNWADFNAGIVGDLQALADPGADRILGWDESANAAILFSVAGALTTSGTDLTVTAANILAQLLTVDGTGSGLDADLLDGQSSAAFATASHAHSADDVTSGTLADARLSSQVVLKDSAISSVDNGDAADPGYRGVPANTQTANYTLVMADAGKQILMTTNPAITATIPANASVAYPVGTVLTFVNITGGNISIAVTSDTIALAGTGTTGTRTLSHNGVATAVKVTTVNWVISGAGLS